MAFWSKDKSKIKLAVMFPHGQKNQNWYSPIKYNNWTNERIIQKTLNNVQEKIQGFSKIQVYDVATDTLIYIIEP